MSTDDVALVVLLLLIGLPRVVLAIMEERPIGAEGAMSILFVVLALLIVLRRLAGHRAKAS